MSGGGKRERLRAERAEAARRARIRGRATMGGAVALVLALAVGVGWYAGRPGASAAESGTDAGAAQQDYVAPAHTTGKDGTVVRYGKADAAHTVSVWLDPRCPFCAGVENGLGATFKEQADRGAYKVEYHFATFLDRSLKGKGSKRALNALGAAVNESPEKFMAYLDVLFAHHPERETDDKFGSTATLLDLADKVDGLRTPAFNEAVKELTYMPWVERVSEAFYASGESGTPVVRLDGEKVDVHSGDGIRSITPAQFRKLVDDKFQD